MARSTCSAATDFETLDAVRANWKALFIFAAESASSAVPSAILCLYSGASSQLALKSFQNVSNSSSCSSPSPLTSTWSMRLLISASDASALLALTSAALSSVTEMLPPPSLSSTLKASSYDMLGARPDNFENPTLFMTIGRP